MLFAPECGNVYTEVFCFAVSVCKWLDNSVDRCFASLMMQAGVMSHYYFVSVDFFNFTLIATALCVFINIRGLI